MRRGVGLGGGGRWGRQGLGDSAGCAGRGLVRGGLGRAANDCRDAAGGDGGGAGRGGRGLFHGGPVRRGLGGGGSERNPSCSGPARSPLPRRRAGRALLPAEPASCTPSSAGAGAASARAVTTPSLALAPPPPTSLLLSPSLHPSPPLPLLYLYIFYRSPRSLSIHSSLCASPSLHAHRPIPLSPSRRFTSCPCLFPPSPPPPSPLPAAVPLVDVSSAWLPSCLPGPPCQSIAVHLLSLSFTASLFSTIFSLEYLHPSTYRVPLSLSLLSSLSLPPSLPLSLPPSLSRAHPPSLSLSLSLPTFL